MNGSSFILLFISGNKAHSKHKNRPTKLGKTKLKTQRTHIIIGFSNFL